MYSKHGSESCSCVGGYAVSAHPWQVPRQAAAAPDAPPTPLDEASALLGTSFAELTARQRLPEPLRDMALYAILQQPRPLTTAADGPTAADGVRGVCRHLKSLGQFGSTAYLAHFYGSSELPQVERCCWRRVGRKSWVGWGRVGWVGRPGWGWGGVGG